MTEKNIQQQIRIELSKYGIVLRLQSGRFRSLDGSHIIDCGNPKGVSDLLFIGGEKAVFIEVKGKKGKVTQNQLDFIAAIKKNGGRAGIARSVEDALELIK